MPNLNLCQKMNKKSLNQRVCLVKVKIIITKITLIQKTKRLKVKHTCFLLKFNYLYNRKSHYIWLI